MEEEYEEEMLGPEEAEVERKKEELILEEAAKELVK